MKRSVIKKSRQSHRATDQLVFDFARPEENQQRLTRAVSKTSQAHRGTGDAWYFAYGSNMSVVQKQQRTGSIRQALQARLMHYRLAFNKQGNDGFVRANIVNSPGSEVCGVAYLCNPEAMNSLDRCEGLIGGHYFRSRVTLETASGALQAEVYIAGNAFVVEEGRPTDEYLDAILSGAREHGLSEIYIDAVEKLALNPNQV